MRLTLKEKIHISESVVRFRFEPEGKIDFKPGQYLRYELDHEGADDRGISRFFTISSAPSEGDITITTRIIKDGGSSFKNRLVNMDLGDEIFAYGPSGDFVVGDDPGPMLFIAGGIGITPFRSMVFEMEKNDINADIVLLYSTRDEIRPFENENNQNQENDYGIDIHYVIHPEVCDMAFIISKVPGLKDRVFYLSGPPGMIRSIEEDLRKQGISDKNIKLDYFPGYK